MKDCKKLLFKLNVSIDPVFCEPDYIHQSTVLKLADIDVSDATKIIRLLDLFNLDKIDYDNIVLRVDHIISYDISSFILKAYVSVFYEVL